MGRVVDRYGRKKLIGPSLVVTLVTGAVTPFMPNLYLVIACSFVLGFCYNGVETQVRLYIKQFLTGFLFVFYYIMFYSLFVGFCQSMKI